MSENGMTLRPAIISDVKGIARLVNVHSKNGLLLPRSEEAILENINSWFVVDDGFTILACGSIFLYSPSLAEIRSLAVDDRAKGNGLGTSIVEALIRSAANQGVDTLFALTRIIPLFEKVGFTLVDKAWFPEKLLRDCLQCPILNDCDEHAVAIQLNNNQSTMLSDQTFQGK